MGIMKLQGDDFMKQTYQSIKKITLAQKKNYLLFLSRNEEDDYRISRCMNKKDFKQLLCDTQFHQYFYIQALKSLYQSQNYDQLEYQIMMMNSLFHYPSYQDIKEQLYMKLMIKPINVEKYCVLRHLIDLSAVPFDQWLHSLFEQNLLDARECAKICLLEDQYHLAYEYLKLLESCDEQLLDLLASYSLKDYLLLMNDYRQKKGSYQLAIGN